MQAKAQRAGGAARPGLPHRFAATAATQRAQNKTANVSARKGWRRAGDATACNVQHEIAQHGAILREREEERAKLAATFGRGSAIAERYTIHSFGHAIGLRQRYLGHAAIVEPRQAYVDALDVRRTRVGVARPAGLQRSTTRCDVQRCPAHRAGGPHCARSAGHASPGVWHM